MRGEGGLPLGVGDQKLPSSEVVERSLEDARQGGIRIRLPKVATTVVCRITFMRLCESKAGPTRLDESGWMTEVKEGDDAPRPEEATSFPSDTGMGSLISGGTRENCKTDKTVTARVPV